MLERLWTSILDLIAQFVTPDWGRIIGLLPVVIFVLIVIVLLRLFMRLMRAPTSRRDVLRVQRALQPGQAAERDLRGRPAGPLGCDHPGQ